MLRRAWQRAFWLGFEVSIALGIMTVAGPGCQLIAPFDTSRLRPGSEYRCTATIVNSAGWVETVASGDSDLCSALGECPRIFNFCDYGGESGDADEVRRAEWARVVAEGIGGGAFRDQPGPWCVRGVSCVDMGALAEDAAAARCRASGATAFPPCAEGAGCLALSQGVINFGDQAAGTVSAARFVELSNVCAEPLEVTVDRHITCDNSEQCRSCSDPGDTGCVEDFGITSDCFPAPGEESRILAGTVSPDPLARRCLLSLTFAPQRRGERVARKVVYGGGESAQVHLSGLGVGGSIVWSGETSRCWDESLMLVDPPCTQPGENLHLEATNNGPDGSAWIESVQLPLGTGFRVVQAYLTHRGSPDETHVAPPVALLPGDTYHVVVRWCRDRSPSAGASDEATTVVVTSDDPASGPSYVAQLRWAAGGCP